MAARASAEAGREKLPQGARRPAAPLNLTGNTNSERHHPPDSPDGFRRPLQTATAGRCSSPAPVPLAELGPVQAGGEIQVALADAQFELARPGISPCAPSQAYFDVLGAQDVLVAAPGLNEANTQQPALAGEEFEVGTVTITDVHEAQSCADLSSAQVTPPRATWRSSATRCWCSLARSPDALKGSAPWRRPGVAPSRPTSSRGLPWPKASNLSVQANQLASEVATREVERNRAGHLPTVDLVASPRQHLATSNR